jgi:hypothetical protein
MKLSRYFAELAASYDAEIQDLLNDSEGKSALKARLTEKRQALQSILPMLEFSPEMVVPVFYDAFTCTNSKAMASALISEPDDGEFPEWDDFSACLKIEAWALPMVDAVMAEPAGEVFMVTAACLEFVRQMDAGAPAAADDDARRDNEDDDGDEDEQDLAEAGDDWLAEQGFDSFKA